MPSKLLLVFCDGTGMDGNLSNDLNGGVEGGGSGVQHATNVLRLSRSVKPEAVDGRRQIVFYQSGVGSEANFTGDPVTGTTLLQALGTAVASKIRDAYAFIAQNFEEGDEVCIFGFSRGAYTARKLSGLIDKIGLLETEKLGFFFKIWKELVDGKTPSKTGRFTRIKCVGVWDTVGSVYNTIDALSIKDTDLPSTIDVALHGLSLQENRDKFLPTLWSVPSGGLSRTPNGDQQVFKQIWFPGAHSDVGGGYERHELADIALFWMAGEVNKFINLDLAFLRQSGQSKPDPWGESQPHNAYSEQSWAQKRVIGHETRLESGQIIKDSSFHSSLLVAPTTLKDPSYMVTLPILKQKFGSSWTPSCPDLNAFEEECKKNWGHPPVESNGPIEFERPGDLFGSTGLSWANSSTGLLPNKPIRGGVESNGSPLYVARAPYEDGLHPGKASRLLCFIPYNYKEIQFRNDYQIFVGDETRLEWVSVTGRYDHSLIPGRVPIPAGYEADGQPLYIVQADLAGGTHCGKVKVGSHAMIPYDYKEHLLEEYRVLVLV